MSVQEITDRKSKELVNIHLISVLQSNSTHLAKLSLYVKRIWTEKKVVRQKSQFMKIGPFIFKIIPNLLSITF
jgi:hypothetical protein